MADLAELHNSYTIPLEQFRPLAEAKAGRRMPRLEHPNEMHVAAIAALLRDRGHHEAATFVDMALAPEAMETALKDIASTTKNEMTKGIITKICMAAADARRKIMLPVITGGDS